MTNPHRPISIRVVLTGFDLFGHAGVPVCASYCDAWFAACKDDKICVEDVLGGYNFTIHGENICPADQNCTTYTQRYKNGQGLCNKMWGSSYVYTEGSENCMQMWFNGSNPNVGVKSETPTALPTVRGVAPAWSSSGILVMIGVASVAQLIMHGM